MSDRTKARTRGHPDQSTKLVVHGTCVAIGAAGVLLTGPSGSGKSDLALRLIDDGAELVADDLTTLSAGTAGTARTAGAAGAAELVAHAPDRLAGRLEARGLGIIAVPHRDRAALRLVVELAPGAAIERLPDARCVAYLGVEVPAVRLDPFEASAAAKVRAAVGGLE